MLKKLTLKGLAAVPYLETSQLMTTHEGSLKFSTDKPNVIVGPNGAGKSALLTTIALRFLAHFTGQSMFDDKYVLGRHGDEQWFTKTSKWGHDYVFLQGLECDTDNAPALYYRPGHVPGNEDSITASMMTGYFELAKEYGRAVDKKSSGQGNQALLEKVMAALSGTGVPQEYSYVNWRFGRGPRDLSQQRGFVGSYDHQAEVLKALLAASANALPLVLMDEPEQSLDARAEAKLWQAIAAADCSKVQVIVATHSTYPLLRPKLFKLVEAEKGYVNEVRNLLEA